MSGLKHFLSRFSTLPPIFEFNIERLKRIFFIGTPILLIVTLFIGWMSAKRVRNTVVEYFNLQQLLLARHASTQIEDSLNHLKRELSLLGLSPSIQYAEVAFMAERMRIAFSSVKHEGALEVRLVNDTKIKANIVNDLGYRTEVPSHEDMYYLELARKEENKGHMWISDIFCADYGENYKRPMMRMVIPVWQVSVDESHPIALNKFTGALMFLVDTNELTGKVLKGIQSGRTGYAWIIDPKGIFLYHLEKDFVGKNAFEVRKGKRPSISFVKINEIQKEKMLKGEEGTSWYISGWHRGQEGEIKKLIAYAPVRLDDTNNPGNNWSVAVVAPISEVEGTVRGIQIGQFLLEGVVVFGILFGGFLIFTMLVKWSSALKIEVDEKTKELRKSEDMYRSLVENAEDIIFTVDKEFKFLSMNRYGYSFLNRRDRDIVGSNIIEIFHDEEPELQLKTIREVFKTNTSRNLINKVKVNGLEHWLSTNFSGLLDEKGNVVSVLGIARDITERRKVEDQMYHTEKLASVGTMAAGVAHEINNPLAIILGFTEMLMEKVPRDSESYEILKTIEKQGLNAQRIVQNLLSFARFSEPKEEEVDVNKVIEAILAVEGNTLLINNISVERDIVETLPTVRGDPGEFQQVFFNILSNAISAMKGGGVLTIVAKPVDNGRNVEVRISDTGKGIKKEHRAKIFDPFFTSKKVGEGTGLGLTITYALVSKYGGSITFETKTKEESERTGTTFIVTLPTIIK